MKPIAATSLMTLVQTLCAIGLGLVVGLAGPCLSAQATDPDPHAAETPETEPEPEVEADTEPEAEPEPDTEPNASTTRSADELVKAIRTQLEQLLANPYQAPASEQAPAQPQTQAQRQTRAQTRTAGLESIATRCEVLANNAVDDAMRLSLLELRARTLAELARLQGANPAPERGRDWFARLRAVGERIQSIDHPRAQPVGAYWQLLADIARLSRSEGSAASRQARTQRLLTAYITQYQDNDAATEWLADARLSLAQLLDERGDQAGAARQLGALGELPTLSPRYEQTQPIRERIARIGMPVRFDGITTGIARWDVADHAGSPVLIHIYADPVESSVKMIRQIQDAIAKRSLGGFSIVSLRVGEALPGTPTPPWPALPVELEPGGVLDQLGIDALPTLIWLDHKGRLASIGNNIAVLDQQPPPPAEPDPTEPNDEGETETEPDTTEPAPEKETNTEPGTQPDTEPDTDSDTDPETQPAPDESR